MLKGIQKFGTSKLNFEFLNLLQHSALSIQNCLVERLCNVID